MPKWTVRSLRDAPTAIASESHPVTLIPRTTFHGYYIQARGRSLNEFHHSTIEPCDTFDPYKLKI